jgi:magnesium and cobalt transporter
MGDKADDSSSAAHGAHDTEDPQQSGGLFARLSTLFGGADEVHGDSDITQTDGGLPLPGLGNLRRMRVEDVAIPRVEITAVPVDIDLHGIVEVFRESGNTRLPVYDGTLDAPLGLIHLKDLALNHGFNGDRDREFDLRSLLRPLLYAPPSMPIGVLLQKMQTDRSHMALVIDEYGGVDGLVTIEDLIEQVIGEIEDEHDTDDEVLWTEEKPGCFAAAARTPIAEFQEAVGFTLVEPEEEEEVDTLGGLVFMMAGRVPARGEVIAHPSGAQVEVIDADPRRIKRLRVRMPGASVTAQPRQAAE